MARPTGRTNGGGRTASPPPSKPKQKPETKIGPFANGVGVCIWLNRIETDQGPRFARSITINPRRYLDRDSQEWKDASGYNVSDLPVLLVALAKAQEYCLVTSLPGQDQDDSRSGNGTQPDEEAPY